MILLGCISELVMSIQIPPMCPYCPIESRLVSSVEVYHRDYGMIYLCSNYPACDAFVGVHKGTNRPKGSLANKPLRSLRMEAHHLFDSLIDRKIARDNVSKKEARKVGYLWLTEQLKIEAKNCHIGEFDEQLCQKTIELCSKYTNSRPKPK